MGRLKIDVALVLFAVVFVNCVVQSQYYVEQPTHIYVVDRAEKDLSSEVSAEESLAFDNPQQFMSRKGSPVKEEEESSEQEDESVEEKHQRAKGRPRPIKLPANFDDIVRRKLQLAKRQRRPLHGDPSPIHRSSDDEDDRKPESRLLWPFSIEISKGKEGWGPQHYGSQGGHGHGHGGHAPHHRRQGHGDSWGWDAYIEHEKHKLNYTAWASEGWGEKEAPPNTGWGSYSGGGDGWEEEKKGLTDEEIMKSKHYKKYQKKKKKIMKKLKKKLKFKRLIQKILQKHITYLDKIVPY